MKINFYDDINDKKAQISVFNVRFDIEWFDNSANVSLLVRQNAWGSSRTSIEMLSAVK